MYLNGPKLWATDWFELKVGKSRDFDGLKAAWVAKADLKRIDLKSHKSFGLQDYGPRAEEQSGMEKGNEGFSHRRC